VSRMPWPCRQPPNLRRKTVLRLRCHSPILSTVGASDKPGAVHPGLAPGGHQTLPPESNADPRPFRWTKNPDTIIAAARRGRQVLDSLHQLDRFGTLMGMSDEPVLQTICS
jgi:hypothetical protein